VKLRDLVEAAVMVALALVLSMIKVYHLPYGGSVTAGSMIPILYLALRRGWRVGVMAGAVLGALQFMAEPYFYTPVQVILDYPLAFGLLGLAGLVNNPVLAAVLGIAGRFVSHLLSGVVFFASYAPEGMNPWLYSAIYNGSYLVPEVILSAIVLALVYPVLQRALEGQGKAA